MTSSERKLEEELIEKLKDLKYEHRTDIRDRASLEGNFREKFQALNRVSLTDAEFQRLLEEVVTPDVFTAAQTLRNRNAFTRDDGTPLNYTLVNIQDWCKNTFEVVSQLRINTDYSHHRYDVLLLINGVPVVQIELKTLGINPRRAIEQIVDYKNDLGNGYTRTLLCFVQLFIVSNRDSTYYFANNNARHFSFNADERFLPIYQYAAPDNSKINGINRFADAFLAKCTLGNESRFACPKGTGREECGLNCGMAVRELGYVVCRLPLRSSQGGRCLRQRQRLAPENCCRSGKHTYERHRWIRIPGRTASVRLNRRIHNGRFQNAR